VSPRLETITLKIETPTGQLRPGRGFYQLEEDALYVPVGPGLDRRRFFSYLEAETVRFDIDLAGRLMLLEVAFPRRRWKVEEDLAVPAIAEPADVRWLDFRGLIRRPELVTDPRRRRLLLRFSTHGSWRWYSLAESVFIQVDRNERLCAVMVGDIEDDLAGRRIAAFRKVWADDDSPAGTPARSAAR
jgi:hypothetical protein